MVEVPSAVLALLRREAERTWPAECCALLVGSMAPAEGVWRVVRAVPTVNIAARPDRFEVAPSALFATLRAAEAEGLSVIGHHHSHPNGVAAPSATDEACVYYPDHAWLITAVGEGGTAAATTAWRPAGGAGQGFHALVLKILRTP